MGRKISIGTLSAEIAGNAQPLISELKKAEAATGKSTTYMDRQWSKFQGKMSRKWGAAGIGASIAKGLGLGGGMMAAQMIADKIAGAWAEAAESAKAIELSTGKQLATLQGQFAAMRTDAQQLAYLQKELASEDRRLQGLTGKKTTFDPMSPVSTGYQLYKNWVDDSPWSKETREDINEAIQKVQEYGAQIKGLQNKQEDEAAKESSKALTAWSQAANEVSAAEKELNMILDGGMSSKQRAIQVAQAWKDIELYDKFLSRTPENDLATREQYEKRKADAYKRLVPLMTEEVRLSHEVGNALAQSFENAVFSGGSLRDMLRGIGEDMLAIAFRSGVTEPMGKWLGTALFGSGLFRATGGPVSSGSPYIVGERGPELFVPQASGRIETNSSLGGGGGSYYIDARGADRTGMARLESMIARLHGSIEPRAVSAVMDAQKRRYMRA